MSEMTSSHRDKLMADLRVVVADAEELLKLTAGELSEGTAGLRQRLQERITQARQKLVELQASATESVKAAGQAADDYVHEHPWRAVGIGAGVGLVVGLLLGRR